MRQRIIIVGGVAGGAGTAARLRRNNEEAEILLLERGGYISFANCGMPYYIGNTITKRDKLLVQTPEAMKRRFHIDVRLHSEVVALDPHAQTVTILDGVSGQTYKERYDKLILATGASPVIPPVPGVDGSHIYTIWNLPEMDRIKEDVTARPVQEALILGGGFVGLEMAENLTALGIHTTLVEMQNQVIAPLDLDMAQYVHRELEKNGVALRLGQKVVGFAPAAQGQVEILLDDNNTLLADLVILAGGVAPNSGLAKDAGLDLGPKGHILTDVNLKTSAPNIYAVGDVIQVTDFVTGAPTAVPLAGPANKQGRIAADNLSGRSAVYMGTQGTSIAKIFDLSVAATGQNEKSLLAAGKKIHIDYEAVYSHPANHAAYYPGSTDLHLKLLYDRHTGRILGAQAVGGDGTDKRIDVLATVIRYNGTVEDLTHLELAYAPPYNTAKDPVNMLGYIGDNVQTGMEELVTWSEVDHLDLETHQLVDVRTPKEFDSGAIPGAINIPVDELRDRLIEMDPQKTIVVYCRVGLRAYIAARILSQAGFCRVKNLTGGWLSYEIGHYGIH